MKKRSDGRYSVSMTIGGKRRYFYGTTRSEAFEKMRAWTERDRNGAVFGDVAREWFAAKRPSLSDSTVRGYEAAMTRAVRYLPKLFRDVTPAAVSKFLRDWIRRDHPAQKTVQTQLQIVRQICTFAVEEGFIESNPARDVSIPRDLPKKKRTAATQDDVDRIVAAPDSPIRTAFMLAAFAGLRRGEILALRWEDVDLRRGVIQIRRAAVFGTHNDPGLKRPKTDASLASVPICPTLADSFARGAKKGLLVADKSGGDVPRI